MAVVYSNYVIVSNMPTHFATTLGGLPQAYVIQWFSMGHDFQFEKPECLDRHHSDGGLKLKSKENHDSLVETSWSHTS